MTFRFTFFRRNYLNYTEDPLSLSAPPITTSFCAPGRDEEATGTVAVFVGDVLFRRASPSL